MGNGAKGVSIALWPPALKRRPQSWGRAFNSLTMPGVLLTVLADLQQIFCVLFLTDDVGQVALWLWQIKLQNGYASVSKPRFFTEHICKCFLVCSKQWKTYEHLSWRPSCRPSPWKHVSKVRFFKTDSESLDVKARSYRWSCPAPVCVVSCWGATETSIAFVSSAGYVLSLHHWYETEISLQVNPLVFSVFLCTRCSGCAISQSVFLCCKVHWRPCRKLCHPSSADLLVCILLQFSDWMLMWVSLKEATWDSQRGVPCELASQHKILASKRLSL